MAEIADMILNGELCERCGIALETEGGPPGFPYQCYDCGSGKRDKRERLTAFRLTCDERGWAELSDYHYRKVVNKANKFDYWPTTCKVSWRGNIFHGVNPEDIEKFIDNRRDK
jgi:hypothetical protein